MAYRRRRSYKRFFRSKRKSVSWSKEQLQIFNLFRNSDDSLTGIPAYCFSTAICSNGPSSNVSFNIAAGSGIRTVKNFTITGAIKLSSKDDIKPSNGKQSQSLQQLGFNGFSSGTNIQSLADNANSLGLALQSDQIAEKKEIGKVVQSFLDQQDPMLRISESDLDIASFYTVPISWALIYVPQNGKVPYLSNASFSSIYEPNQNVIDCGIWTPSAGPLRIRSRMARKLHSGDSIYFCAYCWHSLTSLPANNIIGLVTNVSFCTKCN